MIIERFENHKSANTKMIHHTDGAVSLISYQTQVAHIDRDGWLSVYGLYSATTRKHLGWFMRAYGFTYQLAKQLVADGLKFNVYTGEVLPC